MLVEVAYEREVSVSRSVMFTVVVAPSSSTYEKLCDEVEIEVVVSRALMKSEAVTSFTTPLVLRVRIVSVVVPVPGVVRIRLVVVAVVAVRLVMVPVLAVKMSITVVPNSVMLVNASMIAASTPPPSVLEMVLVVEAKVRAVLYSSVVEAAKAERSTSMVDDPSVIERRLVEVANDKLWL